MRQFLKFLLEFLALGNIVGYPEILGCVPGFCLLDFCKSRDIFDRAISRVDSIFDLVTVAPFRVSRLSISGRVKEWVSPLVKLKPEFGRMTMTLGLPPVMCWHSRQ